MHSGGDFPVDSARGNLSCFPQLLGVLGSPLCELLSAEGEAVFQQADLSHFVSQVINVLALGLDAPFLGDADQLFRVLDLIVAAFLGLVQGVHNLTTMVGVCGSTANGKAQIVTSHDAVDVAATDASGALGGDAAGTHRADAAACACLTEATMGGLIFDPLLPGVGADLLAVFQQSVGSSFHLLNGG